MAEEKGYWFSTENGTHIHAEEGESKEQAMGKKFKNFGAKKEGKKSSKREEAEKWAKEHGYTGLDDPEYERAYGEFEDEEEDDNPLKTESRSMINEKQANDPNALADKMDSEITDEDIDVTLSDFEWQITDSTTVGQYAEETAQRLGIDKNRVLERMKQDNPKLTEDRKMAEVLEEVESKHNEEEPNEFSDSQKDGKVPTNDKEVQQEADKIRSSGDSYTYQMLDRLRMDMEYVLGIPETYKNAKITKDSFNQIWYENEPYKHLALMRNLYDGLKEKPEWLKREKIDEYEKKVDSYLKDSEEPKQKEDDGLPF